MEIFPAIDIIDGKVVRLLRGDYDRVKTYSDDPSSQAKAFFDAGATCLHLVDLDGAKDGTLSNYDTIENIVKATDMFVEVGGGVRDEGRIARYLDAGVKRVILGTAAVNNVEFLKAAVERFKNSVAVGVDALDGFVAVDGWKTVTKLDSVNFCERVRDLGVKNVIYTDISKDGALGGTNLEIYEKLNQIEGLDITASGGVSYLYEIDELKQMNTYAAIVGKAIYEGKLDLKEVIKRAR